MTNLTAPGALAQLSREIKAQIDKHCASHYDTGPRSHLGASMIGNNCSRALWYSFRWISHHHHDGRQQRLFQRGHFEEPRFVGYLEAIGFKVTMFDKILLFHPESDSYFYDSLNDTHAANDVEIVEDHPAHEATAKAKGVYLDKGQRQIRISGCKGHFGGAIDGIAERNGQRFLAEFKTQATGKKFVELCQKGVKLSKPVHYAQMSMYGYKLGLQYAIYMTVNKNDDDLHVEVVELDWRLGESLERKAEMIIFSQEPPAGVSLSPAYFECSYCDHLKVCHQSGDSLVNCRSCRMASAIEDANWHCEQWDATIPKEHIKAGCPEWKGII